MSSNEFNTEDEKKDDVVLDKNYFIYEGTILYTHLPDSYRIIIDKEDKPIVMNANMAINDKSKHVDDNTINGDRSANNIGSGTMNIGTMDNSTTYDNRTITNIENQYTFNHIYRVINSIPEDPFIHDYRDVLYEILRVTQKTDHVFTGFVNAKRDNKIVVCNLIWKRRLYVCNHVNIFNGDFDNLEIGDFIKFKGRIEPYTRKKSQIPDVGLKLLSIEHVIPCEKNITFTPYTKQGLYNAYNINYLSKLSHNELALFYERQLSKIKYVVESNGIYSIEMYLGIIQTVFFEGTREYKMYKERLDVDDCDISVDYVKYVCFVRYLICECDIQSIFTIYTILCTITKRKKNAILNPDFYSGVRKFAVKNADKLNLSYDDTHNMIGYAKMYLSDYIQEFKAELNKDAASWRLDN